MKGNFALTWGTAPTNPKMSIHVKVNAGSEHGKAAHDKFSSLLGEQFKVGVVSHLPTAHGEKIKGLIKEDILMKGAPEFVKHIQHHDASGYYGAFNFHVDQAGAPPQILGIDITTPFKLNLDVEASQDAHDVLAFIKAHTPLDKVSVGSRAMAATVSDLKISASVDIPAGSVTEVFDQVKELIPIPLPVDPNMVTKIIESAELDITMDNHNTLPPRFLNNFWDKNVSIGIYKAMEALLKDIKIVGGGGAEAMGQLADSLNDCKAYIHVFNEKIGHAEISIHVPGLYTLAKEAKLDN